MKQTEVNIETDKDDHLTICVLEDKDEDEDTEDKDPDDSEETLNKKIKFAIWVSTLSI